MMYEKLNQLSYVQNATTNIKSVTIKSTTVPGFFTLTSSNANKKHNPKNPVSSNKKHVK